MTEVDSAGCGLNAGRRMLPAAAIATVLLSGCAMVGPDFQTPDSKLNPAWLDSGESRIAAEPGENAQWWRTFADPALDRLIEVGYAQNLPLQAAGARVLQARAQLAVAIGAGIPAAAAGGGLAAARAGERPGGRRDRDGDASELEYTSNSVGVQAAWEIDLWGKFRRFTESADAQLAASVANYDDVLVSLTADLATAYLQLRTLQQQLAVAKSNVKVQEEGLQIATARFRGGTTDERDVEQAKTILASTKATIPQLEQQIEQTRNAIATLIGAAAGAARRPARPDQGHPAGTGAGGHRHSGRSAAPPPGHPPGRGDGRGAECPDRLAEGRPLPGLLADRHVRLRRQQLGAVRPHRHLPGPQPHLRLRPVLRLGLPQLRPDRERRPRPGRGVPGSR